MQIGKPLRTIIVELLQSPVSARAPDPEPDESEPVASTHHPGHEPMSPWHHESAGFHFARRGWQWGAAGLKSLKGVEWIPISHLRG